MLSRHKAGDIIVMYDKKKFYLVSSSCGDFSITCLFQMVGGDFEWAFTGIYGPHKRSEKLRMWEELAVEDVGRACTVREMGCPVRVCGRAF